MQHFPPVSVIIVGYRSRADLDGCLGSVLEQAYPGPLEILFVDNESGDGSAEYVRARFPAVTVIESGANLGYAGGNNLGATEAGGAILVFLNPDTVVSPGWLTSLVRPLLADPSIGLTTSKVLLQDYPSVINTCGNAISLGGLAWCRGAGAQAAAFSCDTDVPAVSGCSFAIHAGLFRELGGFDERLFMYLEDTDLSWRARLAGLRCRFIAGSVVHHRYQFTLSAAKYERIERNRYRLLAKNLSTRGLVATLPALVLTEALTWGHAARAGRGHLRAKTRALPDLARLLVFSRRQRWNFEGRTLREHLACPPVTHVLPGWRGKVLQQVLALAWAGAAAFARLVVPDTPKRPAPMASEPWQAWRLVPFTVDRTTALGDGSVPQADTLVIPRR